MTTLITHTIITCVLSVLGGVAIGIALVVNKTNTTTPTQTSYNKFLEKQVKI